MATVEKEKRSLGDILVETGTITPLELDEALQRQRLTGDFLGRVLVRMELCEEQDIIEALGVQQGMERIDVLKLQISEEVLRRIPSDVARFYNVIPVRENEDGALLVAMADPLNIALIDDLQQICGGAVIGGVSNLNDVAEAIKKNYALEQESIHDTLQALLEQVGDRELTLEELGQQKLIGDIDNLVELAQEPEVIKIVNLVLLEALQRKASDVHFEVYEQDFRIRMRVDGVLHETVSPPKALAVALVSRVKIMSNMDISERRLPQDSRIELKVGHSDVDIRVATLPTLYGECAVMRLLDRNALTVELGNLGVADKCLEDLDAIIHKPSGLFLATGPTGCGKTTTLYACLMELNDIREKIITCEDPVELQVENLVQVQIREEIGLTFASSLRAILRQDPDIVMVGEIRDRETAEICIEASLTGHLVLSTLHTNSAVETVTRLLDMDVEPFLITASLEGVLAQRLLRRVCKSCAQPYRPDSDLMDELFLPDAWRENENLSFLRHKGCPNCDFAGYKGRVGIFELFKVDDSIREMIIERRMAHEMRKHARRNGMLLLHEEALIKAAQGITTAEEVLEHTEHFED